MNIMASSLITSWQIDRETMETVRDLIFLGFKITADGDWKHEIRSLLLGRKAMTNLVNILKSRDITLPTKVGLVKAWFFQSVVIYRCERWTIKKAEHQIIDAFELLEKTLESSLDCKEIKPVNPRENHSWIFIERTDAEAELQYFGHLIEKQS